MKNKEQIDTRVREVLQQIRPFLKEDGGDIELIEVTDAGVVRVELKGTCTHCSMNTMTFKAGVQEAILREVPEVQSVEAINFSLSAS